MSHGITTVPSNLIWCLQSSHCFLLDNVIEFYWVKKKFYVYSIVCRVETQQFKTHYQNFQILWVFFSNKFSIIPVPCTKHVDLQVRDVFQFSLLLLEILGWGLIHVYYPSSLPCITHLIGYSTRTTSSILVWSEFIWDLKI